MTANSINNKASNSSGGVLCLLLLYSISCEFCRKSIEDMTQVHQLFERYTSETADDIHHLAPALFARLDVDVLSKVEIESLSATSVPHLVFIYSNAEETHILNYDGRKETSQDIFQTTIHYYYRLLVTLEGLQLYQDSIHVYPRQFDNEAAIRSFVQNHRDFLFKKSSSGLILPPSLTLGEKKYISWLLEESETAGSDDFVLFVQCRFGSNISDNQLYDVFNTMSRELSPRSDRLFVVNRKCDADKRDGFVEAWMLPVDPGTSQQLPPIVRKCSPPQNASPEVLVEFMVKLATPSMMWFDRGLSVPIAFPIYRKVHAVLFVDLHMIPSIPEDPGDDLRSSLTRSYIRHFHSACREYHQSNSMINDQCIHNDMVCLVVPSTETRVLTTFGIDVWTPVDQSLPYGPEDPVLPTLMITDQRGSGTTRYYLDTNELVDSKGRSSMNSFIQQFWSGQLSPRTKSRLTEPFTTDTGIRVLNAESVEKELFQTSPSSKHALVFFTSPTCGHCKRFAIIWKQLAELLNHIQWNELIQLYQVDITSEEISGFNITVRWIPDLYYLPPSRKLPLRFNRTDSLGDDVGSVSEPLSILSWLLEYGTFKKEEISRLLDDLELQF